MKFDEDVIREIKWLLIRKQIDEVSFVLSEDNRLVLDALGNRDFSILSGVQCFYEEVVKKKENSALWCIHNRPFLISSYYLNTKMRALELHLKDNDFCQLEINARIYRRDQRTFRAVFPHSMLSDSFTLN